MKKQRYHFMVVFLYKEENKSRYSLLWFTLSIITR